MYFFNIYFSINPDSKKYVIKDLLHAQCVLYRMSNGIYKMLLLTVINSIWTKSTE